MHGRTQHQNMPVADAIVVAKVCCQVGMHLVHQADMLVAVVLVTDYILLHPVLAVCTARNCQNVRQPRQPPQ